MKHIRLTLADSNEIMAACGWVYAADFCPVKAARYATSLKAKGRSARTVHRKLTAIKGFSRWLCVTERQRTDPLQQVQKPNIRTDRRGVRRALTDDEIGRLLHVAEQGPAIIGMSGPDRAILYRVALGTGLRASELRSLTPQSSALGDLDKARVVVEAGYSKHRRRDVLPIRRDVAEAVAAYTKGTAPTAPRGVPRGGPRPWSGSTRRPPRPGWPSPSPSPRPRPAP
ncbi:tyrosine-type recombinase/integrase [bacterium]|nr:tyrosine-type recombinase/integrase [bacterium]